MQVIFGYIWKLCFSKISACSVMLVCFPIMFFVYLAIRVFKMLLFFCYCLCVSVKILLCVKILLLLSVKDILAFVY